MITYSEFIKIAWEVGAMSIIECWDESSFQFYIEQFGPMTKESAYEMCRFTRVMDEEEACAGEYFSRRQGLTKSLLSGIL